MSEISKYHSSFQKECFYLIYDILLVLSKVFESLLNKQISEHFEIILLKPRCGFRKGYSAQDWLLIMLEICKDASEDNKAFGAL